MSHAPFVPLRVLSSYSLLEGAIDPKALAKLARDQGFPAVAVCDRNGLYGTVAFASACAAAGVQPIVGMLLGIMREGEGAHIDYLPLYAQDEDGWQNLCHLASRAHLDRPLELDPHVRLADLDGHCEGLIALTGAAEGAVARLFAEGKDTQAEAFAEKLAALFPGRLYIELSRTGDPVEDAAEERLVQLAYDRDLPLVATNPACFGEPHMHAAHDALLCIAGSTHIETEDRRRSNSDSFVKSAGMMEELFADLPEATANTLVIAQRCAFAPPRRKPILPSLAGDLEGEARMLAEDARAGLARRLAPYGELTAEERATYEQRLEFEVDVITNMGFPGYFLIVADFIKWAKSQGIPVGPGRGSGAGSLVAWSLTITDLDPIRLGLLFERFLNPERVSMPDFDIDFCETRRGEVIRYVQRKYGGDHVAQIITFGKLKARAVLRDTGRILQMSYGHVDRLCKMVPNHPTDVGRMVGHHLAQAIDMAIAHLQDAARIAQHRPRLQLAEGYDLGDVIAAIFALHVTDHLAPPRFAEIDVEVRHRHAFGVEESLEQQAQADGIEIGDGERPGDQATRAGTAPRPHRNALGFGPFDEIGNDQEIAGKAHIGDDVDFEFQPLFIGRALLRRQFAIGRQPPRQPRPRVFGQHPGLAFQIARQAGQDRLAARRREGASLGDDQGVRRRFG